MCEIEIWNFGPFKFCVIVELDENRFEDLDQETKNVATSKSNSARKSTKGMSAFYKVGLNFWYSIFFGSPNWNTEDQNQFFLT